MAKPRHSKIERVIAAPTRGFCEEAARAAVALPHEGGVDRRALSARRQCRPCRTVVWAAAGPALKEVRVMACGGPALGGDVGHRGPDARRRRGPWCFASLAGWTAPV